MRRKIRSPTIEIGIKVVHIKIELIINQYTLSEGIDDDWLRRVERALPFQSSQSEAVSRCAQSVSTLTRCRALEERYIKLTNIFNESSLLNIH